LSSVLVFTFCRKQRESGYVHIGPDTVPTQSYERPPEVSFDRSSYAIQLNQMTSFYDVPGEAGYLINGEDYGFSSLSFIMTETHPHGGPPLHTHETEEAHVVFRGTVEYVIGDRRFSVEGPYVARVPAGVPHTFLNIGAEPLNLTAVFPSGRLTYKEVGANPLVKAKRP
jgi:mannose-6-phosphate isomerase-like protein (cupin superfamily)